MGEEARIMAVLSIFKSKKKKSRKSYLIEQIDAIISLQVRNRDGWTCRKCGRRAVKKNDVANHHIFGKKAHPATRWNLENCLSLCFWCHRDAHASPEDFRRWVISWMGEKEYEALYIKAQYRAKFKEVDLEWMLKDMRKQSIKVIGL